MENNGFNKIVNNINEQRGNFGEPLIEKLGLKIGKEISLIKRSLSENSDIVVGQKIEGKLIRDVHIGLPIELENSNTSPIKEIKEEQGKYFVKTLTSVYELFLQAQQSGNLEKISELQETIKDIESHISEQPQSIKDMFQEMKDKFYTTKIINGKNFMFTQLNGDSVMALVSDEKNPNKYKTRVFRFSGSDHQWKSLPGERDDGTYMKGDEENPLHHYVQSAKLHKDIYRLINKLPQKYSHYSALRYVPQQGIKGDKGHYWEEFEFKEKYLTLKNKEWAQFQDFCQRFYKGYDRFVMSSRGFKNFTLDGGLYKWLTQLESIPEFKNIKTVLEEVNKNPQYADLFENTNLTYFHLSDDNPELKKIADTYHENISSYVEKCFKAPFPKTMLPDFSESNCIDKYTKEDIRKDKDNNIYIEEYKVSSPEGDEIIFAMARDEKGRIYIDNIYDPRVGVGDYGIPSQITQMGHLVYKPEDYADQCSFGFPEKYNNVQESSSYRDISALWENIPMIKNYKEELIKRGILK